MLQKARAIHDTDTTTSSSPCSDFHCPKKGACSSTATTARRVLQGHGHKLDTQVSVNGYASICETHGAGYVPALCLASESHECAADKSYAASSSPVVAMIYISSRRSPSPRASKGHTRSAIAGIAHWHIPHATPWLSSPNKARRAIIVGTGQWSRWHDLYL